jgi:N-acetylmuramoyl-L-alanine amidase
MSELVIHQAHLPYAERLEYREPASTDLVVIHCTELPDLTTTREYGKRIHYPESATGNSGHYYIDRNGRVEQWVPPERVAHHVRGFNKRSIGIELMNRGRFPHWLNSNAQEMTEPYSEQQISSLIHLLDFLCAANRQLKWISGHEQLDTEKVPATDDPQTQVYRKRDPGPLFPWQDVLRSIALKPYR